jgi:hypothetical protein
MMKKMVQASLILDQQLNLSLLIDRETLAIKEIKRKKILFQARI